MTLNSDPRDQANLSENEQLQPGRFCVARLLVLGHRQVGKSAAIVRYTTGRYIQRYHETTHDWLYRHRPARGLAVSQGASLVELIEQRDIGAFNPRDLFASFEATEEAPQTLASRAALDQRLANEQRHKKDLEARLKWADAYVVMYAMDDLASYNKAADYLELIKAHQTSRSNCNFSPMDHIAAATNGRACNSNEPTSSSSSSSCSTNSMAGSRYLKKSSSDSSRSESIFEHHDQPMKPTLLLANKQDLGSSLRQVSSTEGRHLAMRHRSMFAELSVAQSKRLIDGCLTTLLDQIEPSALYYEDRGPMELHCPLVLLAPSHRSGFNNRYLTRTQSSGPLQANLVKIPSRIPLIAEEQSYKFHELKSQAAEVYEMRPPMMALASSVDVRHPNFGVSISSGAHSLKRQIATSCKLLRRGAADERSLQGDCASLTGSTSINSYQDRYRSLKSSFKKASMAIVGGKKFSSGRHSSQLARGAKPPLPGKRNSTSSDQGTLRGGSISDLDSIVEPPRRPSDESSIAISQQVGRSLSTASDTAVKPRRTNGGHQTLNRFNRSLFKYRSRRKTVAFEQVAAVYEDPDARALDSSESIDAISMTEAKLDPQQTSTTPSDLGLSSSTSPQSMANDGRSLDSPSGEYPRPAQRDCSLTSSNPSSNANSSRASTSGGSYDESCDELTAAHSLGSSSDATNQSPETRTPGSDGGHQITDSGKKHYFVKCMQSTLSNLTRSSAASSQPAKRSFCSSIFRAGAGSGGAVVKKVVAPSPVAGIPSTESARAAPVMVGFCK